jgi:lipoprotein-anchoring transpeptidase ErfK/SrfK
LNLYQYGHLVHSYPVVLGRKPGQKLYEGDQRTPTGLYMIIDKDHHRRWSRFMLLDYPTGQDVRRYWQNVAAGVVPRRGGGYPGVGGEVGIHGTDRESFNRVGINWTLGCISLFNLDVQELYSLVQVGTLVYIKD